jgi:hypothetical protein
LKLYCLSRCYEFVILDGSLLALNERVQPRRHGVGGGVGCNDLLGVDCP